MTLPQQATINNYGSGVLIDAVPLVDPSSEMPASALNPLRNDCSAMTNTCCRVMFQFDGYDGYALTLASSPTWAAGIDSVYGNNPAQNPTLTWVSTGLIDVQLPATVYDQLSDPILLSVRWGRCSVCSGTTPATFIVNITSATTATIRIYDHTGALNDLALSLITCEFY